MAPPSGVPQDLSCVSEQDRADCNTQSNHRLSPLSSLSLSSGCVLREELQELRGGLFGSSRSREMLRVGEVGEVAEGDLRVVCGMWCNSKKRKSAAAGRGVLANL